jgi:hypothetical protein
MIGNKAVGGFLPDPTPPLPVQDKRQALRLAIKK